MASLRQYRSGNVAGLDYREVSRMARVANDVEMAALSATMPSTVQNEAWWLAVITSRSVDGLVPTKYGGSEVEITAGSYVVVGNGRTMNLGDENGVNPPAVNLGETNGSTGGGGIVPTGTVVWVHERYDSTAKLSRTITGGFGAWTFPAEIVNSQTLSANRWRYAWREAYFSTSVTTSWLPRPSGLTSTVVGDPFVRFALNGCEAVNDNVSPEGVGVDTEVVGAVLTMQPIAAGVVVDMHREVVAGTPRYWFSLPNAWNVVCEGAPLPIRGSRR